MKAFSISIKMMMVFVQIKWAMLKSLLTRVYLNDDGYKNKVFFPHLESLIILEEMISHKQIIQLRPQVNHAPNGLFYVLQVLLVTVIRFYFKWLLPQKLHNITCI